MRIDPDSRQQTENDSYVFLIDPTSLSERISLVREKGEFSNPTVVTTSRDLSEHDETGRDASRHDETIRGRSRHVGQDEGPTDAFNGKVDDETRTLREQLVSLEIDKRVRDGLLDQMKVDRAELLSQLRDHVGTITTQSREIGKLETRLELAAPPSDEVDLPA